MSDSTMTTFYNSVKKAAVAAVNDSMPCGVFFGTVTSVSPLKISIEQKMELDESFLILTSNVVDHEVDMTVEHFTEKENATHKHNIQKQDTDYASSPESHKHSMPSHTSDEALCSHSHEYIGRKKFLAHYGLDINEKVILLRLQGGQKFIVLDRVR